MRLRHFLQSRADAASGPDEHYPQDSLRDKKDNRVDEVIGYSRISWTKIVIGSLQVRFKVVEMIGVDWRYDTLLELKVVSNDFLRYLTVAFDSNGCAFFQLLELV